MHESIRRYRLLPEGLAAAKQRVHSRYLLPQLGLLAGVLVLGTYLGTRHESDLRLVVIRVLLIAGILTWIVFRSLRRLKTSMEKTWATYTLEIGPDYLLRTQADTTDLRLPVAEIQRIERLPGRFVRVVGPSRRLTLGIPEDIEGFSEILGYLGTLKPVSETRSDRSVTSFLVAFAWLAAFVGMSWSTNPTTIAVLAVAVVVILVWSIVSTQRNPNLSRRAKRSTWFYLLLIAVAVYRFLFALKALKS
jgi:hypothetical protein